MTQRDKLTNKTLFSILSTFVWSFFSLKKEDFSVSIFSMEIWILQRFNIQFILQNQNVQTWIRLPQWARKYSHFSCLFFCLFHFLKYYYLICVFETNLCYFSFYREYLHKNKTEDRSWQFLNWLKRQINREIHFDIISLWSCNLCFKINQVFHFLLYFEYSILINDNPNCVVKNVISC